jgi:hypothetical protein
MVKMNTDGITFAAIGWGEISHEISRSLWWMNETHLDANIYCNTWIGVDESNSMECNVLD